MEYDRHARPRSRGQLERFADRAVLKADLRSECRDVRIIRELKRRLGAARPGVTSDPYVLTGAVDQLMVKEEPEAPEGNPTPRRVSTMSDAIERDPRVISWVLDRANGRCELCQAKAPFLKPNNQPFLEVHHVTQLADGGPDTVENARALCPNCHREIHYGVNGVALTQRLKALN